MGCIPTIFNLDVCHGERKGRRRLSDDDDDDDADTDADADAVAPAVSLLECS